MQFVRPSKYGISYLEETRSLSTGTLLRWLRGSITSSTEVFNLGCRVGLDGFTALGPSSGANFTVLVLNRTLSKTQSWDH